MVSTRYVYCPALCILDSKLIGKPAYFVILARTGPEMLAPGVLEIAHMPTRPP